MNMLQLQLQVCLQAQVYNVKPSASHGQPVQKPAVASKDSNTDATVPTPAPACSSDTNSTAQDVYQMTDAAFHDIINVSEPVRTVVELDFKFAHEAPVYLAGVDKLFFVSNRLGDQDSPNQTIELRTLEVSTGKLELLPRDLTDKLSMPNGATNWPGTDDTFVLLTQGHCNIAPAINKVNLRTMATEVLLDSYQGKQFNSPNDVVIYKDGSIWFTDPPYGHAQHFRPEPKLGSRVYAYNPTTGAVDVVADNFVKPNGVVFSPDFTVAYVTDTGDEDERSAPKKQTIYVFDVVPAGSSSSCGHGSSSSLPSLQNRRVFAVIEHQKPDGIKVDAHGNVYTGTTGGIEVFAQTGQKLGTIACGHTTNLAFVGYTIYCLCETKILAVRLKVEGAKLP